MASNWKTIGLKSEAEVCDLLLLLHGKHWLSRGQSELHGTLIPSIDRDMRGLSRERKLACERSSINLFRETVRFFADDGEKNALTHDVVALMVLRHYGVPTRLLDWSRSPYVAAYFAVQDHDKKDGELWSFDRAYYEEIGKEERIRYPETTSDGSGHPDKFDALLTAFLVTEPSDWITTGYYGAGFPRQNAQSGAYTMTARFGRDHAEKLKNLLNDDSKHCRYVIPARLKKALREILRDHHGIWRGTLFPDSAGAADTAARAFPSKVPK
jgi:hypothetical protein